MIKIYYIKATVVIITIVYLLTGFTFSSCTNKANNPKLPNIVFVFADDQRANTIHALGNGEIITPNLDRLAAEGIYFTNTYIMGSYSAAVCQPSRAMLLTGKYLNNLTEDGARIPPADTLIGQRLLEAGYNCFGTGKYHNDEKLGEIIAALHTKGIYDNTIIIYSGDNGLALGQHGLMGKQNLYEHSTKVPLIISGKGITPGQKSNALVYLNDLYPTICEMIGKPTPPSVDGSGFFNLIKNPGETHRSYIVTSYKS